MKDMLLDDLTTARRVLEIEANCILAAKDRLDDSFKKSVELISSAVKDGGKAVVCGIGKSGKIAAKIAGTFSSVGVPAIFMHATEGGHGDLGIVSPKDVFLAISNSGNSEEVLRLLPTLRKKGIRVISILGNLKSQLASQSDLVLDGSVAQEACPLNLAPTSSTTVALALGDALAVALSLRFELREEDFVEKHPAGALGRRLTLKVSDLMKAGDHLPWVNPDDTMDAVVEISTAKKLGAVLVRDPRKTLGLLGLITDGDIRRALKHREKFFDLKAKEIMAANPTTVKPSEKAIHALELMENRPSQISVLPVLSDQHETLGQCIGLVRLHDLIGSL